MITVSKGLKIGMIVLQHLQDNEELKNIDITVGTFTNCRERGLTFAFTGANDENGKYIHVPIEKWFTWCVYEHRNSDSIIINGKKGLISLNGDLPYMADSKNTYLAEFNYNEHYEVAQKLATMIIEHKDRSIQPVTDSNSK